MAKVLNRYFKKYNIQMKNSTWKDVIICLQENANYNNWLPLHTYYNGILKK